MPRKGRIPPQFRAHIKKKKKGGSKKKMPAFLKKKLGRKR
jgi:hypothetical protein